MLPKIKRLNLSREFRWVAAGKKVQTPSFSLMYRISNSPDPLVGVAISKQAFRKATERSVAKRKSFIAAESIYSFLPKGAKLVIMPRQPVLRKSQQELVEELENVKNSIVPN